MKHAPAGIDLDLPVFNVLYIGAGGIVFGNDWVHWNHSAHLERALGRRLCVVGIVDPNRERFDWVMSRKVASLAKGCYDNTRYYASVQEAAKGLAKSKSGPVQLIMLATPPQFRGSISPGRDLELQILATFGKEPAIFTEKPVTTGSVDEAYNVAHRLGASGNLAGVGYMLRYLKVVQKAMRIIQDNRLVVMSVQARYVTAYSQMRKAEWWDKEKQGGPIVEQATHFCDLCRYLGGEVVLDTVRATALEHHEKAGRLSYFTDAIDESNIPPENRIPRVTSAFWKYGSGAIGSLTHIIALHGITYANEIDVVADGYQLRLVDLYKDPTLYVRYPDVEKESMYHYPGDDPFYNELTAITNAKDMRDNKLSAPRIGRDAEVVSTAAQGKVQINNDELFPDHILSSYEDATKTYEFSWTIRLQSEKTSSRVKTN